MKRGYLIFLWIVGLLFGGSVNIAFAQNSMEQAPASIRWYRIRTSHFNIFFPKGFNREGLRMANTLEHLYEPVAKSLGVGKRKASVILQNVYAVPNGFVTIAPRRAEFFTFPTQDYYFLGGNDWLTMLAVHELRHVVQYEKSNEGASRLLYLLWGERGRLLLPYFAFPPWWWEGDAVGVETALSRGGRGRFPYMSLLYRANLLERGSFSYTKQVLGSFQHPIPNEYPTGYYLTTYLRRKYGTYVIRDVWREVTKGWGFLGPFGFSIALKKVTGQGLLKTYQHAHQELSHLWKKQVQDLRMTPVERVYERKNKAYTNYCYPKLMRDGSMIALKSGIGDIPTLVLLDSLGGERVVFTPGIMSRSNMFSLAQGKIVWNEFIQDPRWQKRSYCVIKLYDIATQKAKTLTHKSRYNSAALSADGTKIVTVESDESYHHALVVLDAGNGEVLQHLPNPENYFFLTPSWSEDGKYIVTVKCGQSQSTISLVHVATGEIKDILCTTEAAIGYPVMLGHYIFYNAGYTGIDNIYAFDLHSRQVFQVTSRKYGAYNPTLSPDRQWLIFNDFGKDGMDIVKMRLDSTQWTPLPKVEDRSIRYYDTLVAQENNATILAHVPAENYPIERYKAWKGFFNVHSWEYDVMGKAQRFLIQSQDLFSTIAWSVDYARSAEGLERTSAQVSYQGWYPIIDVGGSMGNKKYKRRDRAGRFSEVQLQVKELSLGLRLPLVLTNGYYEKKLTLATTGYITQTADTTYIKRKQVYSFLFSRLLKRSQRDLHSKWGQVLMGRYTHTPYGGDLQGDLFFTKGVTFFPGLLRHHSLRLEGSYKSNMRKGGTYPFINRMVFPGEGELKDFKRLYHVKAGYALPIVYPDWGIGVVGYLKRVRADLFYDFAYGSYCYEDGDKKGLDEAWQAWGADVWGDFHLFTLPVPMKLGLRMVYLAKEDKYVSELLFGIKIPEA